MSTATLEVNARSNLLPWRAGFHIGIAAMVLLFVITVG